MDIAVPVLQTSSIEVRGKRTPIAYQEQHGKVAYMP